MTYNEVAGDKVSCQTQEAAAFSHQPYKEGVCTLPRKVSLSAVVGLMKSRDLDTFLCSPPQG